MKDIFYLTKRDVYPLPFYYHLQEMKDVHDAEIHKAEYKTLEDIMNSVRTPLFPVYRCSLYIKNDCTITNTSAGEVCYYGIERNFLTLVVLTLPLDWFVRAGGVQQL